MKLLILVSLCLVTLPLRAQNGSPCAPPYSVPTGCVNSSFGLNSGTTPVTLADLAAPLDTTPGARMRGLAVAAAYANPLVNPPLQAVAAWQPNTAYTAGSVVSNQGNDYFASHGGLSAANGGPLGTGAAPITDNTVTWFFFTVTNTTASYATAPAVTVTTSRPTGLTTDIFYSASPDHFQVAGGTPLNTGYNTYCIWSVSVPARGDCGSGFSVNAQNFAITFQTDAPHFAIIAGNNNTQPWRIIVDGQYVSLSATLGKNTAGTNYYEVNFGAAGARLPRTITIESGLDWGFKGVAVSSADTVWAPSKTNSIRAIFVGDSITVGTAGVVISDLEYPHQVCKILGWNDCWNEGSVGTGYIASASGVGFKFIDRINDVTQNSPDIVVVMGGTNESSNPPATITAAVQQYLSALRTALPSTPIVVTGLANTQDVIPVNINAEKAVAAAVTSFNDANIYFIPIVTDPAGPWFTGSGSVTAPNGTGNNDVYGYQKPHMTQGGYTYLAARIANALRPIIAQLP